MVSRSGKLCILTVFMLFGISRSLALDDKPATVVSVKDGDTFVAIVEGKTETIRLIGIDAPESWYNDKAKRDERETGVDIHDIVKNGRVSADFLKKLLKPGSTVRLEFDRRIRDQYARLLCYVYLPDGTMLNELLVRKGNAVAKWYPPNTKYHKRLVAAQGKARQ